MASNTETAKLPESQLIAIVAAIVYAAGMDYGIDASVKDAVELIQKSSIASEVKA